jgi:hypothetical protein
MSRWGRNRGLASGFWNTLRGNAGPPAEETDSMEPGEILIGITISITYSGMEILIRIS